MSNIGKQIRVYGNHVGKVIAETFKDGTNYDDSYLVLLNSNGMNEYGGWNICGTYNSERVKLCKEYGKNSNNFFYFFGKGIEGRFEFFETKTMENE